MPLSVCRGLTPVDLRLATELVVIIIVQDCPGFVRGKRVPCAMRLKMNQYKCSPSSIYPETVLTVNYSHRPTC